MTDQIRAPWTSEQVAALNAFQQRGGTHPFTCGYEHPAHPNAILQATTDGWRCYVTGCGYEQGWAHEFMADPSRWPASAGVAPATDRAAPVKQRADCTELEWAEQERARFERLYTRETVRVDQADEAARRALEQRQEMAEERFAWQERADRAERRAEAMERAMQSTAADALKHRGCHRDLMAQCLRAERAEAAVERVRALHARVLRMEALVCAHCGHAWPCDTIRALDGAEPPAVVPAVDQTAVRDRIVGIATPFFANFSDEDTASVNAGELAAALAAVLPDTSRAAALAEVEHVVQKEIRACGYPLDAGCDYCNGVTTVLEKVRRLADDAQPAAGLRRVAGGEQHTNAETHSCGNCEGVDPDTCLFNPNRPPEQCPNSEFDGYGLQCQKPAGHNLCTFEEPPAASAVPAAPDTEA